jgi:ribosomal protein S18 acetylase RimI-like enzyme
MPKTGFWVLVPDINEGNYQFFVGIAMKIDIELAKDISDDIVEAISSLLPQLSAGVSIPPKTVIKEIISCETSKLFIARDLHSNRKIVGMLTLVIFSIPSGRRAWIEDVVVDSASRKKGIGELLTRTALKTARDSGAKSVYLTSRSARTSANQLYQKLGFVKRDTNLYCYNF